MFIKLKLRMFYNHFDSIQVAPLYKLTQIFVVLVLFKLFVWTVQDGIICFCCFFAYQNYKKDVVLDDDNFIKMKIQVYDFFNLSCLLSMSSGKKKSSTTLWKHVPDC